MVRSAWGVRLDSVACFDWLIAFGGLARAFIIANPAPCATLFVGTVASVIALGAILANQRIARQRETLNLIEKRESTEHYREISRIFFSLVRASGFDNLNVPSTHRQRYLRSAVLQYLNHYEMVSIGLRQKMLDEKFYRAWMEGAFVRDWNAAADFIQRERWKFRKREIGYPKGEWSYRASIYANFQYLAEKWSPEARHLDETTGGPPSVPAGPGDMPLPRPVDRIHLRG